MHELVSEHQALVDATLARDATRASQLLTQHIDHTSASLRAVAQSDGG